jgi:hypothetical protein
VFEELGDEVWARFYRDAISVTEQGKIVEVDPLDIIEKARRGVDRGFPAFTAVQLEDLSALGLSAAPNPSTPPGMRTDGPDLPTISGSRTPKVAKEVSPLPARIQLSP